MYQKTVSSWDFKDAFKQAGREINSVKRDWMPYLIIWKTMKKIPVNRLSWTLLQFVATLQSMSITELQIDYPDIEDIEDLQNHTTVIMVDDRSFIIQAF